MFKINPQLASASGYRLLNKKDCDIQSVICSFVLLHHIEWGQPSFTSTRMSELLKDKSGFQIPSAVVQEALLAKGRQYFNYDKKSKSFIKNKDCPENIISDLKDLTEKTKSENENLIKEIARFIT